MEDGAAVSSDGPPIHYPLSAVYRYLRPLLFRLDAEAAHHAAMRAARLAQTAPALVRPLFRAEDVALGQSLWGLHFANPVGLAAGFDKNAELVRFWAALGFGFAEVGSVTARPSPGNPRPRAFRLPEDRALINRMGLNNDGAEAIAARLAQTASALVRPLFRTEDAALGQSLWGLHFANPVGLAAGFDKNAELVRFWAALGFGFAEVGSVTARPSPGNPRPRAFRLPEDRALINRMGLNNDGAEAVAERLGRTRRTLPLGINLAKTHDPAILGEAATEDFVTSFRRLAPLADYVALNVSCPNTAEGKTFEEPESFDALLAAVMAARQDLSLDVPVLVKLSPPPSPDFDPGPVDELVEIALGHGVGGFIAANTASDRTGLRTDSSVLDAIGRGGLSGAPLEARATALVRHLYRRTDGRMPILGVGGVDSAEAAYRKIRAGASLVELYTALVYEGPGLVRRINRGLVRLLDRDGFASIADAVGADA